MTDTPEMQHDETAAPAYAPGTFEHLDPHTLVVDTNVRDVADLDVEFVANIKEHGVLIPIAAVRASDGQVLVRMGQRRTLAAREAGLPCVPVYVRPLQDGDEATQLIQRVAEQIVENDQRQQLTEAQRARGIQQMLAAGASVTKVAKKLSIAKTTVKDAATVNKSATASTALDSGQLSLSEAAILAEFADMPGALERLTAAAGTRGFDHEVERLRQDYLSWQAEQAAIQPWRDKGFRVLDERPRPWDIDYIGLSYLIDANGEAVTGDIAHDPAVWVVYLDEDTAVFDAETGEEIDESSVDWDTEEDPQATPKDGLRHANTVKDGYAYRPHFYCVNYTAAGLTPDERFLRNAGVPSDTAATAAGDDSDEAAAARAATLAKAQAQQAEHERRERRKVIALNRLGEAATTVRRDFVAKLLARKTLPKGAGIFIATCLVREPRLVTEYYGTTAAAELLGVTEGEAMRQLVEDLPPTGDGRALVVTLAIILGGLEARATKDAWRSGGRQQYLRYSVGTAEYIAFLAANGYELSDIERVITGERTADDLYEQTLATADEGSAADTESDPQ